MLPQKQNHSQEDRICDQYIKLCEKSTLLFTQLYETSFLGDGWRPLYQKTFTTFAKLWKLQQTYRGVLETGKVKFKRYDVGEIAAKIAQLYYHYYLRTSETQFLNESLTYYQEIKKHNYYKEDTTLQRSFILQRTLRFHARYLLICLLTDKLKMGENVLSDFALTSAQLATEKIIQPNFQNHQLLAEEMKYIVMNIVNCIVRNREGRMSYYSLNRIHPQIIFNTRNKGGKEGIVPMSTLQHVGAHQSHSGLYHHYHSGQSHHYGKGLKLHSAIIVDNKPNSYSFSELSIPLIRMMYSLEYNYAGISPEQQNEWKNPRKYLLRNIPITKLLYYLSSNFYEMPTNNYLLLYLSSTVHEDVLQNYSSTNGLFMSSNGSEQHILHPEDILPFIRKPMFIIIDSDKQNSFIQLTQKTFDVPLLTLFGPIGSWQLHQCPLPHDSIYTKIQGKYLQVFSNKKDSIFNLFLNDSLGALCRMTNIDQISSDTKDECLNIINTFFSALSDELFSCPKLSQTLLLFMNDDFARILILRFIFCRLVLVNLKMPADVMDFDALLPTSKPQIPVEIYGSEVCKNVVKELADVLSISHWFDF